MTICLAILAALPAVLVSHAVYLRFRATFRALEGSRKPLLWAARLGLAGCALPGLLAPLAALWAEAPALAYLAIGLMSATVGALAYPWRQIARKPKPRVAEQLVADMAALAKARIAFHFTDATLSTPTHVEMWIDVLDATGVEWYVICRERHHHEYFLRSGRARLRFRREGRHAEICHRPSGGGGALRQQCPEKPRDARGPGGSAACPDAAWGLR